MIVRKVFTTSGTSSKNILNLPFGKPSYDKGNSEEALSKCLITKLLQRERNSEDIKLKGGKNWTSLKKENETNCNDASKKVVSKKESHGQTHLISNSKVFAAAAPCKEDELNVLFVNKIPFSNPCEEKMLAKGIVRNSQQVNKLDKLECDLTTDMPRKTHDLCAKVTKNENTPIKVCLREKNLVGKTESDFDKWSATSRHSENKNRLSFSKVEEITNREIKKEDKIPLTVDDGTKTVHKNKTIEFSGSTIVSISREIKDIGKPDQKILTSPFNEPAILLENISKKVLPPLASATSCPRVNSTNKTSVPDLTVTSQRRGSLESGNVLDRPKKSGRFANKKRPFLPIASITKSAPPSLRNTMKEILLQGKSYSSLKKSKIDSVTKRNTRSGFSPLTVPATKNAILSNVQTIRYKSRFRVQLLPMGLWSDSLPDITNNLKSDITVSMALPCKLSDESRKMSHASDSDKNERKFENNVRFRNSKFESNVRYSVSMESVFSPDSETNLKSFLNWKEKKIEIKGHQVLQALKTNEEKKSVARLDIG